MRQATTLLKRASAVILFMVLVGVAPVSAQIQEYTTTTGFDVSWTLDPRAFPTFFTRGPAFGARGVRAGMDFDGDGQKEFLFTTDETLAPQGPDPGYLDVYLYENTGDDTYEHVWHYTHLNPSNSLPPLEWGDLDNDGRYEIYFGIPTIDNGSDLFVFEQDENGLFPDEPTVTYGYERLSEDDFRPAAFAMDDIDGDGQVELVTTSRTSNRREVVVISPVGDIDAFTVFKIELEGGEELLGGGAIYDTRVVDYDGDGMKEVWVNTWDLLSMTIWEATGPDSYELQVDINDATPDVDHGSVESLLFEDFDGDGQMELLWPSSEGGMIYLPETDDVSTLSADDFVVFAQFTPGQSRGATIGDLDGDEQVDVLITTSFDQEVIWAEYDGGDPADSTSYTWTTIVTAPEGSNGRFYPPIIADDLDGDGFNEIVIPNYYATDPEQPLILILEANGEATAAEEEGAVPSQYALSAGYPNPFNPATSFSFTLPTAETVSLRVYDVMGRLVKTLVDGQRYGAGTHQLRWDATNQAGATVSSGTYLITLEYGHSRLSRPISFVK